MKLHYIFIPLVVLAVLTVGSFFTQSGMEWYETINLPSWTPQGEVIGLAWTIIFIMAALSIIIFWNKARDNKKFTFILWLFVVNGFLNVLWSFLFFNQHLIGLAAFDAGLLALSVLFLIVELWSISKSASLLLVPYFLWVGFATFLNYSIFIIN